MSECRAVVNSLGNAVAGIVVARWQGEIKPAQVHAIMAGRVPGFVPELAPKGTAAELARQQSDAQHAEPTGAMSR
jgi:aerobic C4-dicarboxylate transport protein